MLPSPATSSTRAVDDCAPMDMLARLFEARGWPFAFESDDEVGVQVQGSWGSYQLRAIWRREDRVLQVLCLPEIRVSEARVPALHELIGRINEQVWLGHFELWSQGRILLYRHAMLLGDDGLLSLAQAQALVEAAIEDCDRFYPAFQFALWGDKSPREALDAALIDAAGEA